MIMKARFVNFNEKSGDFGCAAFGAGFVEKCWFVAEFEVEGPFFAGRELGWEGDGCMYRKYFDIFCDLSEICMLLHVSTHSYIFHICIDFQICRDYLSKIWFAHVA